MRLFVTGATGFIGSHFVEKALAAGHEVVGLRRSPAAFPKISLTRQPRWIDKPLGALGSADFFEIDVLVHLAAAGVTPQPATWDVCYQVNVAESLQLVRRAVDAGVERLVVAGSYAEYGRAGLRFDPIPPDAPLEPTDPYAASKASCSVALCALCRAERFRLSYHRLFSVFGEGQFAGNFWPSLRRAALAGEDFPMTDGEQVRDFIAVEEVAHQLLRTCTRLDITPGEPLVENIGTGHPQKLRDFAEEWWKKLGAAGKLQVGALRSRPDEVKRYIPLVNHTEVIPWGIQ